MSVVLNMVVGNEERAIERCLLSVRPFIDAWCVHCNGSDSTASIVRRVLGDKPGKAVENVWVDQEHNRNLALADAKELGDHALLIDADEYLVPDPGFTMPVLDGDCYELAVRFRNLEFARPMIVRTALPWRWVGKRHPGLWAKGARPATRLAGLTNIATPDGASWSDPAKYQKQAADMEEAVAKAPTPRNHYYLAQCYRDARMLAKAREAYLVRSKMGGWDEEVWSSLYEAAKLAEALNDVPDYVVAAYLTALRARASRAESPYRLARYMRLRGQHATALFFAHEAVSRPKPPDRLFVEADVYEWRALDELSLAAHRTGDAKTAREALAKVRERAPAQEQARLARNATFIL